jgi:hypothetical protein
MGKITWKKLEINTKLYFFSTDIFLSLQGALELLRAKR